MVNVMDYVEFVVIEIFLFIVVDIFLLFIQMFSCMSIVLVKYFVVKCLWIFKEEESKFK